MKALVVYDSYFGNTEQVAQAIGSALGAPDEVEVVRVGDVRPEQLEGLTILVVGSPTRAFRATPAIRNFVKSTAAQGLQGVSVAGFDTRIEISEETPVILRFLAGIFGYAAEPISAGLEKKGGELAAPPAGFIVKESEGPLRDGELERAADWARHVAGTATE